MDDIEGIKLSPNKRRFINKYLIKPYEFINSVIKDKNTEITHDDYHIYKLNNNIVYTNVYSVGNLDILNNIKDVYMFYINNPNKTNIYPFNLQFIYSTYLGKYVYIKLKFNNHQIDKKSKIRKYMVNMMEKNNKQIKYLEYIIHIEELVNQSEILKIASSQIYYRIQGDIYWMIYNEKENDKIYGLDFILGYHFQTEYKLTSQDLIKGINLLDDIASKINIEDIGEKSNGQNLILHFSDKYISMITTNIFDNSDKNSMIQKFINIVHTMKYNNDNLSYKIISSLYQPYIFDYNKSLYTFQYYATIFKIQTSDEKQMFLFYSYYNDNMDNDTNHDYELIYDYSIEELWKKINNDNKVYLLKTLYPKKEYLDIFCMKEIGIDVIY